MYQNLKKARTRRINKLWHVGSMKLTDKGTNSQEGNGLSVSLHPEEWTAIARLGGGDLHEVKREGGAFLDFHRLGADALQQLQGWGVAHGWLQLEPRWRVEHYDSEAEDTRYFLCATEEAALAELEEFLDDDPNASSTPVSVPCLTEAAFKRLGFKLDPLLAMDIAATFWVEDETKLDGVWWNDTLAPEHLSAPRGVICLQRLPCWEVRLKQPAVNQRRT